MYFPFLLINQNILAKSLNNCNNILELFEKSLALFLFNGCWLIVLFFKLEEILSFPNRISRIKIFGAILEVFTPYIITKFGRPCLKVVADFGFKNIKMVSRFHSKIFEFLK